MPLYDLPVLTYYDESERPIKCVELSKVIVLINSLDNLKPNPIKTISDHKLHWQIEKIKKHLLGKKEKND